MNAQFRRQPNDIVALLHPLNTHSPELFRIPTHSFLGHFATPFSPKCANSECLNLGVQSKVPLRTKRVCRTFSNSRNSKSVIGDYLLPVDGIDWIDFFRNGEDLITSSTKYLPRSGEIDDFNIIEQKDRHSWRFVRLLFLDNGHAAARTGAGLI